MHLLQWNWNGNSIKRYKILVIVLKKNYYCKCIHVSGPFLMKSTCRQCQGTRVTIKNPCLECHGKGSSVQRKKVTVPVPAGI